MDRRTRRIPIWIVAGLLVTGCSALGPRSTIQTDSADEALAILQATEPERETVDTAVAAAATEVTETDANGQEAIHASAGLLAAPRFDLMVDAAEATQFFRNLVAGTPYNMVVHPDVEGEVTLQLKDVTVAGVMEIMRNVYGYDYSLSDNVFQVFPDALRTEIYHVDYLNISRKGSSEMQVSAGKVSDSRQERGYGDENYSQRGGEEQVVGTIINTDAQANLWEELNYTLQAIVSVDKDSSVVVTPQVGLVVVKAMPKTLHAVSRYLSQVEDALTRQVVLEAKVIEVTLNEGFEAGINWHTFGDSSGGEFANSEHAVAGELEAGVSDGFNPLGTVFSLHTAFGDFASTINLLATQGTVQVLSSPRIATVNNQKAVIKVGSDEFFVTDISSNTVTAGSAINTNDSPELTPFFSGIALDVTPQISAEDEIILHVHPTVSEVTEQIKQIGGEPVPLAASTIRESDSIVKARNGQIIVIGGLMQNSAKDNNAGVPWLRRAPVLGNLFKQKSQTSIKSELVILLKPMVIDPAATGSQSMLDNSSERVAELRDLMRRRG